MTFTEEQLRETLRRTTDDVPDVGDRVAQVQRRVRRRRQRTVATVAAVAAAVVLAVPVVRVLADRRAQPATDAGAAAMDATMKYAAFVAWWDGIALGVKPPAGWDAGVHGVSVTTSLPPTTCAVVSPLPGEPAGTQAAWVLGQGSVFASGAGDFGVITTSLLWPVGVTGCDPRPSGTLLVQPPPSRQSALLAAPVVLASTPDDPTRPALDVEAVYRAVPAHRLTQHGREVFAQYQASIPSDYGSSVVQTDRVLGALGSWVGIAMSNGVLTQSSPQTGPTLLTGDSYVGTAQLPAGFSARWGFGGSVCVEGSIGDSGVRHVSRAEFLETAETGSAVVPRAGACPAA